MAEFAKIFQPRPYHDEAREALQEYLGEADEGEGDEGDDSEGDEE